MTFNSTQNSTGQELITTSIRSGSRIDSIDFLRGIVMIIMALDHIRGYLHFDSLVFSPTDLQHTTPSLFTTRLITHICAPAFIFLAGTSAYFIAQRKTLEDTSFFLITRGLWLIVLQMTLIRFVWNFDPAFHYNSSTIISTIGFSMILLSVLIHLRIKTILFIGLILVIAHNMLDNISFRSGSALDIIWSFLHVHKSYSMSNNYSFLFLYPIIPWVGVMALGYCFGHFYSEKNSSSKRKKMILQMGGACLLFFTLLRLVNIYGDPEPWAWQENMSMTIMSFFNLEKYPPSLLFLSFTLGISLMLLGMMEGKNLNRWKGVIVFGRVALFYYVVHILIIHIIALVVVVWSGFPWHTMIFIGSQNQPSPLLKGKFGFSLFETYLVWIAIILLHFPLCNFWNSFKSRNKLKWWVSYL